MAKEKQFEVRDRRAKFNSLKPKIKYTIWGRDDYICAYCGNTVVDLGKISNIAVENEWTWEKYEKTLKDLWPVSASIDHKIPLIKGGGNELDNLITCCIRCNCIKGKKLWKLK